MFPTFYIQWCYNWEDYSNRSHLISQESVYILMIHACIHVPASMSGEISCESRIDLCSRLKNFSIPGQMYTRC